MKILMINKFFYLRGGSERVFFNEAELLRKHGHRVLFFSMADERNLSSAESDYFVDRIDYNKPVRLVERIVAGLRILYSFPAAKKLSRLLDREKPDLAHLHNIHHQLSPSILPVLHSRRIPVVMTLHDYKMVCPAYLMISGGRPCERCRAGRYYQCLFRRCTKGSYAKSLVNVIEMYLHHTILDLYRMVNIFISPSRFLREKLLAMGFRKKIIHLPYSFDIGSYRPCYGSTDGSVCYFGRLAGEKGLFTLLDAMEGVAAPLKIIGDGPIVDDLRARAGSARMPAVRFLGHKSGEKLISEIAASRVVVVPSEWYENCPSSVLEAFALGKPVIGSRIGGIPELVRDGETGLTFEPGNAGDLREKLKTLLNNPGLGAKLGGAGRKYVESNLDPARYYPELLGIYRQTGAQ